MSIRRLPDDVVGQITSSATLTSLNGVVCGLLKNSLDAGASRVNICVDYCRGNCTVEDNGCGIEPSEFAEDGGLGKAYFTSKHPPTPTIHGRQGRFLASLAALSLTTMASHHHRYHSHNAISIHHGQVLKRHRPARPEERLETFDHGTRVAVFNLFGAMPVRVKHRAALFSNRARVGKEWERLSHDVVALLLAWPSEVSVSLRETNWHDEVRLKAINTADIVLRTTRLFVQASLGYSSGTESWIPVSASLGHKAVTGCFSLDPAPTQRCQFISLGISPIENEFGVNVLYEEVNKMFKNSSFGVVEGKDLIKPRKGVDKWPMFYLQVSEKNPDASVETEDLQNHGRRDLEEIVHLLKAVSYGFLKKHCFRPLKLNLFRNNSVFSTQPTTASTTNSTKRRKLLHDTSGRISSRNSSPSLISSDSPFGWHLSKPGLPTSSLKRQHGEIPPDASMEGAQRGNPAEEAHLGPKSQAEMSTEGPRDKASPWLQNVMKSWVNPVFETAGTEPTDTQTWDPEPGDLHRCGHDDGSSVEAGTGLSCLSKEALKQARVIGQVDDKYILLSMPWKNTKEEASQALVLVDQHAADERRRLEELMAGYFRKDAKGTLHAVREQLEQPLMFEVSEQECRLFQRYQDHFAEWGVMYGVELSAPGRFRERRGESRVAVTALPPSILERCRSQPRLLVELMRKEIWELSEQGTSRRPRPGGDEEATIGNFRNCPQGILELLHSRSCRSAIMFNDVLSMKECKELIRGLAQCALPFRCAHGRPSMVLMMDLGPNGPFAQVDQ